MGIEQQWNNAANVLVALVTTYGLRVVGAILIFCVGWMTSRLRSAVVALHATSHAPAAHLGEPVAAPETGAAHTLVQLPQWFTSVFSSKQPLGGHLSGRAALMQA